MQEPRPKIKVLIAERSALVRQRIVELIQSSGAVEVICQAGNGVDAISETWRLRPDVVVLDIHLQNGSGIDVLKRIKKDLPSVRVIVLAWSDDPLYREACLSLGADAYLNKAGEFYRIAEILEGYRNIPDAEAGKTPGNIRVEVAANEAGA